MRPPADAKSVSEIASLSHETPPLTILQAEAAAALARGPSRRCVALVARESRRTRPWLPLRARHGQESPCPYGCARPAGCTCRTCTHLGRQVARVRVSYMVTIALALTTHMPTGGKFEGGGSRLGREMTKGLQWELGGPTWSLGRAMQGPLTSGAEPSGGSTPRMPRCEYRWRLTPSASLRSADGVSMVESCRPLQIASMHCADASPTGPAHRAMRDVDTPLRLRPKRVGSRLWSARLGEMNSMRFIRKYTRRRRIQVAAMQQLAVGAVAAFARSQRGVAVQRWRAILALVRGGQRRRRMLHTPLDTLPGTEWSY